MTVIMAGSYCILSALWNQRAALSGPTETQREVSGLPKVSQPMSGGRCDPGLSGLSLELAF